MRSKFSSFSFSKNFRKPNPLFQSQNWIKLNFILHEVQKKKNSAKEWDREERYMWILILWHFLTLKVVPEPLLFKFRICQCSGIKSTNLWIADIFNLNSVRKFSFLKLLKYYFFQYILIKLSYSKNYAPCTLILIYYSVYNQIWN